MLIPILFPPYKESMNITSSAPMCNSELTEKFVHPSFAWIQTDSSLYKNKQAHYALQNLTSPVALLSTGNTVLLLSIFMNRNFH